jgi:DNA-binding protein HU-beta
MNKTDLINAVAEGSGLKKIEAEKAVNATIDAITNMLLKGEKITLVGFGTFEVAERKARTGKNPRTGDTIKIPATKVAKFKPGKLLKENIAATVKNKKKK